MSMSENYRPTPKNPHFDHCTSMLKPMYDLVAEGSESEKMRPEMGQRVKDHPHSTTLPTFHNPCTGDDATYFGQQGLVPTCQELPTLWGRETRRVESNGLEAGESGEVNPGIPNY